MEETKVKGNREDRAAEAGTRKNRNGRRRSSPTLLERIQPDAAGIDCGSESHYVAVPRDRDTESVREFRTFTADLHRLADWLVACGIKTVAMESTGVYWIPLYEILEVRGLEVVLVNARDIHNVRGRKSDVSDCEWIQELHSVGLLRPSFRPKGEIVALRALMRHRETQVKEAATRIQRMQKALDQMNLKLHNVITDITGVTGLKIVRDILDGVRDPRVLAAHRDHRCQATEEEIAASLLGNYRDEHLFALRQNFEAYEFFQRQMQACDTEIEKHLKLLAARQEPPKEPLPPPRRKVKRGTNDPRFEIRPLLHHLTGGTDLSQIDAIGPYAALQLISELGTDMSPWRTEKQFTSWLTLAPNNKISGGRLLSSRTQPSANRAAAIFRRCAMSLTRTTTALGAFYRRLAARIGKAQAITATARKLAVLVYRVLRGDITYRDAGALAYEQSQRNRTLRGLRKRAKQLGFGLVHLETGEISVETVS